MADIPRPTFEKSPHKLVALFEELAPHEAGVTQKKMFGWPWCFMNGNLFLGLQKQSLIFRLSDRDRAEFLKIEAAADFEPMPGRKMTGYAILVDPLQRDRAEIERWMGRSLAFARTLPEKGTTKAPAKKRTK
jgi:TfoX/Sxy family transcriptional regulator of competence genes